MTAFDLPRDRILRVDRLSVRLDPGPHPFVAGRETEIAAHWARAQAANPALFNGRLILLASLAYRDGDLAGRCHMVDYATFLYWRSLRPVASAEHAYAHAVLTSRDDALVAIRMGPHTINAGKVYFAAGSFEPVDFRDGEVDLHFNMRREVLEETGIDLDDLDREPQTYALSQSIGTVIFRRYRSRRSGEELAESIRRHVAADADPEIEGPVLIRSGDALGDDLAPQMPGLIAWHFSR